MKKIDNSLIQKFMQKVDSVTDTDDKKFIDFLITLSENLVLTNSVISNAIHKKAQYAITDFEIIVKNVDNDHEREQIIKQIREKIIENLKLRQFLIDVGIDYSTYGIAIPTIEIKGEKYYYCKECHTLYSPEIAQKIFAQQAASMQAGTPEQNMFISQASIMKTGQFDIAVEADPKNGKIDFKTNIKCPKCNKELYLVDTAFSPHTVYFENARTVISEALARAGVAGFTEEEAEEIASRREKNDNQAQSAQNAPEKKTSRARAKKRKQASEILTVKTKKISLTRWNVKDIEIFTNRFTTETYVVIKPEAIKEEVEDLIRHGPLFIKDIDIELLYAAKTGQRRIISSDFVEIIKHPTPSGISLPFFPPLARSYREAIVLMHALQTLLEATKNLVPISILVSPQDRVLDGGVAASTTDIKAQDIEEKIAQGAAKLYKYIFLDYPVQEIKIGGATGYLSLVNVINGLMDSIIGSLDMPKALLLEGTWSGNIVAMRLLENSLVHYVNNLDDFLDKLVRAVKKTGFFSDVDFEIRLIPFRRVDMVQEIELMAQILGPDNIPKEQLFHVFFGKDMTTILEQVRRERALLYKQDTMTQIELELLNMGFKETLAKLQQERQTSAEDVAKKVMEELKGAQGEEFYSKLRYLLLAIAEQFSPDFAHSVFTIIKKEMKREQIEQIEVDKSKDRVKPSKKGS